LKAVVVHGKGDFRYEDVPDPKAGEEEVVVKIGRCGICAADPKIYHGNAYFAQTVYDHARLSPGMNMSAKSWNWAKAPKKNTASTWAIMPSWKSSSPA